MRTALITGSGRRLAHYLSQNGVSVGASSTTAPAIPAGSWGLLVSVLAVLLWSPFGPSAAAESSPANVRTDYAPLEWLVGEWQAEFRPRGEGTAAPTMSFSWADDRHSYVKMSAMQPTASGTLDPEYEGMIVWHPVKQRLVFVNVYLADGGLITEDGDIEILEGGSVRLNMKVHYPPGERLPFSDDAKAGSSGHTLEFRRTFHQDGEDRLRGVFRIKRDDGWESPKAGMEIDGGFPWRRVGPATEAGPARPQPLPAWVLQHWEKLVGRWVADNSAYRSDGEPIDAFGLEWSWGLGRQSLVGRLYGIRDGKETATFWEFREFWHPGDARVTTEQFGGNGTYGVGTQTRQPDGSLEMAQTFFDSATGTRSRVGHRSTLEGDSHTTRSYQIDVSGEWTPGRTYVWKRQQADG